MSSLQSDLTERQEEFCRFVDSYRQKNGIAPSFEEIAKGMKLKDGCSARDHFHLIRKKGYVANRRGSAGSIRLTDKWRRYLNRKLNAATSPAVDEVAETHPELFEGWTAAEWDELRSIRGMGGEMTEDTVIEEAKKITENREVHNQFHDLLLCESTRQSAIDWVNAAYGEIDVRRRLAGMRNQTSTR